MSWMKFCFETRPQSDLGCVKTLSYLVLWGHESTLHTGVDRWLIYGTSQACWRCAESVDTSVAAVFLSGVGVGGVSPY